MTTPLDRMLKDVAWRPLDHPVPATDDMAYATHEGELELGGLTFRCYQLNTGERVFDAALALGLKVALILTGWILLAFVVAVIVGRAFRLNDPRPGGLPDDTYRSSSFMERRELP